MVHTYDQRCCPEVYFVLLFARESIRGAHKHDPGSRPEVYFVLLFDRDGGGVIMVPGWHPVAWGRGCLSIGNSDKPFPEGEEGELEKETP